MRQPRTLTEAKERNSKAKILTLTSLSSRLNLTIWEHAHWGIFLALQIL